MRQTLNAYISATIQVKDKTVRYSESLYHGGMRARVHFDKNKNRLWQVYRLFAMDGRVKF